MRSSFVFSLVRNWDTSAKNTEERTAARQAGGLQRLRNKTSGYNNIFQICQRMEKGPLKNIQQETFYKLSQLYFIK